MKKIILLFILLALIYGGYRYVQAYLTFNQLGSRIDLIVSEPQSYSLNSMKTFISEEAAKLEIPLPEENVEIAISETDRASLGKNMLERPGITTESRLLTIHFSYPVKIYGFSKTFSYDIEKVFTSKASLVNPYME